MAQGSLGKALRHTLLRLAGVPASADGQLLERFVDRHDEEAFAELVRRHGPMVLRVCQRVLGHAQDAEDAFQATFIVLARKSGSIARPDQLSSWLHGVAVRVACKARAGTARHRARELPASGAALDPPAEADSRVTADWRPVLDEELGSLPERFRAPVVLCYLEGKTGTEAAAALGCSLRTITLRLARAREVLHKRLERRGVALAAGALATLLAQEAASAAVPAPLAIATMQTLLPFAAGKVGLPATPAQALADATLKAMAPSKLKMVVTALLLVVLIGGLAAGIAHISSQPIVHQQTKEVNDPQPGWRLDRSIPVADLYELGLSPDGRICVSTSDDHTVRLWDAATGKQKAMLPVEGTFARFSPDGRWVVLSDLKANKAHIVETASAKVICSLPPSFAAIFAATAPALVTFDSFESNAQVRVYDVTSSKLLDSYRLPPQVSFLSAESRYWAALSSDGQIKLHDLLTGKELTSVSCPGVKSLSFSRSEGEALIGISASGVTVWQVPTLKELGRYQTGDEFNDWPVAPDGRWLAVGRLDGTVQLVETATGKQLWRKQRPRGFCLFSPDGNWLLFTGQDSVRDSGLEIWDRKSGRLVLRLPSPKVPLLQEPPVPLARITVNRLSFSQDCRTLTIGADGAIQVWRLDADP